MRRTECQLFVFLAILITSATLKSFLMQSNDETKRALKIVRIIRSIEKGEILSLAIEEDYELRKLVIERKNQVEIEVDIEQL